MTTPNEINAMLDRVLRNTPEDSDMETLRRWLQSEEGQQFAQKVTQPAAPPPAPSKFNISIGRITNSEIQYGDRIYHNTDTEKLRTVIETLKEPPAPTRAEVTPLSVRKILVLAASPVDEVRLNLEKEVKAIDTALRLGKHREQFELEQRWGVSRGELQDILLTVEPEIVHFCGHGSGEPGLILQNAKLQAQRVSTTALAELFELIATYSKPIACVVLNACYSEAQATAMSPFIDYIVGMDQKIGDRAAIQFSSGFYRSLSNGLPYEAAFRFGRNAIDLEQIPEHLTPVLLGKAVQK